MRAEGNRFLYMHELCIAQKYVTLQNLVTDNTLSYKYVGRKNFLPTYTSTDILKAVSPFECNWDIHSTGLNDMITERQIYADAEFLFDLFE